MIIMILKLSCLVLWRFIFVDLKILPRYRHLNKNSVVQGHCRGIILRSQCLKLAGFYFVVSVLVNAQIHVIHKKKRSKRTNANNHIIKRRARRKQVIIQHKMASKFVESKSIARACFIFLLCTRASYLDERTADV